MFCSNSVSSLRLSVSLHAASRRVRTLIRFWAAQSLTYFYAPLKLTPTQDMQSHEHDDGRTQLDSSFDKIIISNDTLPMPTAAPVLPPPPNPWADEQPKLEMKPASTPDLPPGREETSVFSIAASSTSTDRPRSEHIHMPPKDVLREFDPLSDQQELDARDAWASSEGHPAPQDRTTPGGTPDRSRPASVDLSCNGSAPSSRPSTPGPQPSTSTSSSASPFPSLTAIARSLSIPTVARPRSRPTSMDTAKPIAPPSPGTAASFAAQQQAPAQPAAPSPLSNEVPVQPVSSQSAQGPTSSASPDNGSGDETPRKEKEPSFDFQKFLDQMKSRGAEPVAKYLRS